MERTGTDEAYFKGLKELSALYLDVKSAIIMAEELDIEHKLNIAPLNQLRNALDHIFNGLIRDDEEKGIYELKEAKEQMENSDLTKKQTWILNHQLFMAYNDAFFRTDNPDSSPTKEDEEYIKTIITQLLEGIDHNDDYDLFHAELLRESGRFTEAFMILDKNTSEKQKWVVDAMMKHIIAKDPKPFLLVEDGNVINY